jgi:hypothetical protein
MSGKTGGAVRKREISFLSINNLVGAGRTNFRTVRATARHGTVLLSGVIARNNQSSGTSSKPEREFEEGRVNLEETLLSVWQQVLVEEANTAVVDGRSYPVSLTSRNRLRQVDFDFAGNALRGLEQNPQTKSRWAQLARQGKKVMQFLKAGRYVAVIADGIMFTYQNKHQ